VLDQDRSRGNEAGEFGVAEFAEEAEDVAVGGLFPKLLARTECATDEHGINALVKGGGEKSEAPAFTVTGDPERAFGIMLSRKKVIDGGLDFQHFVSRDRPSQQKR
jgi:hypothetical protein